MKKEIVVGIGIAVAIIAIASIVVLFPSFGMVQKTSGTGNISDQNKSGSTNILGGYHTNNILLNTPAVQSPDQVLIYRTLPTVVTKDDAIAFAKKFNITDLDEPSEGDAVVSVTSKDWRYETMLYKTGGLVYWDSKRDHSPNGLDLIENLPSDADAEKIVTAFLKERDLLPEGAVLGASKHNKAYQWNQSGGPDTVVWEDILLGYHRELNDMKVEGTQYMVDVGAHGDIISFYTNWKYYEPIGRYSIKSGDTAFGELKQNGVTADVRSNSADSVVIDGMHLAYLTKPNAYKEYYLEPVWVFEGRALNNGTSVGSVKEFIPALTDESVQSISGKLGIPVNK